MKNIFLTMMLWNGMLASLFAQSPVIWTFEFNDKGQYVEIKATATMQKKWAIYSQLTDDEGPIPTSFHINDEKFMFTENTKVISEMDPFFEIQVLKFKDKAIFTYQYEKKNLRYMQGYVNFMSCDDERCLPPKDVRFNYSW